jgi:protoporphyrinogen oxidase
LKKEVSYLEHSSGVMIGIGIKGNLPDKFKTKCWNYFPEENCPFYRVTIFSNYSPNHTPKGCWSLLTETSYSQFKEVDKTKIVDWTIKGLINTQFLSQKDVIASKWTFDVDYSYPIPTLKRDIALKKIQPILHKKKIYSRGRFGAWKYEIGNMDHSVMQGVEIVNKILLNEEEKTWQN